MVSRRHATSASSRFAPNPMTIQAVSVSPSGPRSGNALVHVVPDRQVLGGGLDRGLVHDAVALQGVHVASPDAGPGLGHGQEQVAADGQVAQHQVSAVGAGQDRAHRVVTGGFYGGDPVRTGAIASWIPWVNSAVVRASSRGK
jgi:hypothetical protein